ncbi:metalloproteinase inhibitor 2-like [Syngnathoides biaculeatus]|uniref:metalloproteinase inhibitor 2-like n=1 Tax=Syngnathoides biaculeatus TaxID=300417 RepID=UPI002ADE0E32|nr:metalloproteinase inhibitor 2-like [Syngnathoides biaculeatus]
MSWLLNRFMLPLVLLFCRGLQENGAQACTCLLLHPQQVFCQVDVVIKAKVVSTTADGGLNPIKYDIQQIKNFKGPEKVFAAVYTASSSAACGITLTNGVEYLLMARLQSDGSLYITSCDFHQPWDDMSATQKSLLQLYGMGCDCKITRCSSLPCGISSWTECLWTDFLPVKMANAEQARNFACVKRREGSCAWYRGSASPAKEFRGR